jgi:hypothetical protein
MFFQIKVKSEPLSDEAYDDGVVIEGSYPDNEVSEFILFISFILYHIHFTHEYPWFYIPT